FETLEHGRIQMVMTIAQIAFVGGQNGFVVVVQRLGDGEQGRVLGARLGNAHGACGTAGTDAQGADLLLHGFAAAGGAAGRCPAFGIACSGTHGRLSSGLIDGWRGAMPASPRVNVTNSSWPRPACAPLRMRDRKTVVWVMGE